MRRMLRILSIATLVIAGSLGGGYLAEREARTLPDGRVLPRGWSLMPAALAQTPSGGTLTNTAWQATIATASSTGTAVSSFTGAPTFSRQLMVQPLQANGTGKIEIQTTAGTAGFQIAAGEIVIIPVQGQLTGLFLRVFTNGDGASFMSWKD